MIVIPELFEKVTGLKADDVFLYPPALPPKRLLKSETCLPANIVDVVYSFSFELGQLCYIEVQNDTDDEIHEDDTFLIFFNEKAGGISSDDSQDFAELKLPAEALNEMREFVQSSFLDEKSLLHQLMNERKKQWEDNAKKHKEQTLREKNKRQDD